MFSLDPYLKRSILKGSLSVTFPDGATRRYGDGSGEPVAVTLVDRGAERAIWFDPMLQVGEMYMAGRLTVQEGSIYDFLCLAKKNGTKRGATAGAILMHVWRGAWGLLQKRLGVEPVRIGVRRARENIARHYDLEEQLFRLFLDDDLQYSCAYFGAPGQTLEEAQLLKKRHIAAKLLVEPGQKVLELGCGWGGMGLYLGSVCEAEVDAVTLSKEQHRVAAERAAERGIADRVRFACEDYRNVGGQFDRIVAIGILEHVGRRNFRAFFEGIQGKLDKRGVAVAHFICRTKPSAYSQPFGEKYIFPGGYSPALSEVLPEVERAGLLIKDIEILPIHYADTLAEWRRRLLANSARVIELFDEEFLRMWELYLAAAESSFRHERIHIAQIQMARHQDAVPFTRDYIAEREAMLRERERQVDAYADLAV